MRYALLTSITLLALIAANWLPPTAQAGEPRTITLAVANMTCSLCPFTVRKALQAVPGVIKAEADYRSRTATVTFDPEQTNVDTLTHATANAGFPSTLGK